MNTNRLEKQLESWVPRRPSAGLKERIFAANTNHVVETAQEIHVLDWLKAHFFAGDGAALPGWVKLAPACCIALIIMFLSMGRQEKSAYLAVAGSSNTLASLSSNWLAMWATDAHPAGENVWSGVTFDWTKETHPLSTIGSCPNGKTNFQRL